MNATARIPDIKFSIIYFSWFFNSSWEQYQLFLCHLMNSEMFVYCNEIQSNSFVEKKLVYSSDLCKRLTMMALLVKLVGRRGCVNLNLKCKILVSTYSNLKFTKFTNIDK